MEEKFFWTARLFEGKEPLRSKYFEIRQERDAFVSANPKWQKRGKICAQNLEKHLGEEEMKKRLSLHIPKFEELWYREKIMNDPETMSYNSGYDLDFEGYHKDTGCIDFPENEWREWYDYFIGQEPERFYAYIVRDADGKFLGEVNVHKSQSEPWHEMGIVLEAKYRGKGYAVEALELLLQHAFDEMGVLAVHNDFEDVRDAAVKTHLSAGFKEYKRENGLLELLITKEEWAESK